MKLISVFTTKLNIYQQFPDKEENKKKKGPYLPYPTKI